MSVAFIRYKDYMGGEMIDWNIEEMCGYKPKTTYFTDFGIAERLGVKAVKDTYSRAFRAWSKNIEWMTELVMVFNWKIHEHHMLGNEGWIEVYTELFDKAREYVETHFTGDDLAYYYRTTD